MNRNRKSDNPMAKVRVLNRAAAEKIVARILDQGLGKSTWRDNHPAAYDDLLNYRADMIADVETILQRTEKKA